MPVPRIIAPGAALLLALGLAQPPAVFAQAVPTPGAIQDQLRKPVAPPPMAKPVAPTAPASPTATVPPGGRKILVRGFEISGNTALGSDELQQVVAPYAGKELTLEEIYQVADSITRYYRTKGYTLAAAIVPQQKVSTGQIRLEVIEGKLGQIRAEGNRHYRESFLRWQLNQLKSGEVLRNAPLEREMLLLNELPGLSAKAVMQPGADFGTSDLVLQTEEKWANASLGLNNYGRESIGEYRLQADAALNGLLGIGDRFDFTGLYAEGNLMHYGRMAYSMPISPSGTRATMYYSRYGYHVDTKKIGAGVAALDINGEGENFGFNLLHPVWRSERKSLYLGAGYDRTVTVQEEETLNNTTKSHLGIAQFTALFNYLAPDNSFSTVGATLSTNFQGTPLVTEVGGGLVPENNTEAAKLQVDLSHYRAVWRELGLLARFTGAVSADPLSDLDQFRLGGPTSVRAYPASEVGGDDGFFASAELQHPFAWLPVLNDERVKAFVDTGTVYRQHSGLRGLKASESLSGAGIGLSATAFNHLLVDVLMAHPFGQQEASDRDDGLRFWVSVNAQF